MTTSAAVNIAPNKFANDAADCADGVAHSGLSLHLQTEAPEELLLLLGQWVHGKYPPGPNEPALQWQVVEPPVIVSLPLGQAAHAKRPKGPKKPALQ